MATEENSSLSGESPDRSLRVDLPTSSDINNIERWAIVVGISKYKHESWNLKYADRDAEAVYELLRSPLGGEFKADHVVKLTNQEATTDNIINALRSFLKKPAPEDIVLIYFACHGSPDLDNSDIVYLLTHDTNPRNISGTAVLMREIKSSLQDFLRAERVIVLADTCHSAAIGDGMGRRSTTDNAQLVNQYLTEASKARKGVALLTSAEQYEVSFEDAKWGGGHGVFTHYLLEGMQGEADINQNGIVTVGELFEYVRDKVQEATENRQNPSIGNNPFDRNFPLAITFPANRNSDSFPDPITAPILASIPTPTLDRRTPSDLIRIGIVLSLIGVLLILIQMIVPKGNSPTASSSSISTPGASPATQQIKITPSESPSLSNPSIIIRYFPQQDAEAVKSALAPFATDKGLSDQDPELSTNAIWFGSEVRLEDVKLVAKKLLQANIPIKSIRPFNNPTSKPFVIEVGTDRDLPPNMPVLTLQEINNAKEFKR